MSIISSPLESPTCGDDGRNWGYQGNKFEYHIVRDKNMSGFVDLEQLFYGTRLNDAYLMH